MGENWEKQLACADDEDVTREMISACMETENRPYGNPASFCFHHFCPFKCKE